MFFETIVLSSTFWEVKSLTKYIQIIFDGGIVVGADYGDSAVAACQGKVIGVFDLVGS